MSYQVNRPAGRNPQRKILSLWVIAGSVGIACVLLTVTLVVLVSVRLTSSHQALSTAILEIQPAVFPTATSAEAVNPPPNALEATPESTPAGEVAVGAYVQVTGTGGDGLRVRDQPGLSGKVLFVGSEAEIFEVDDGPVETDGYVWWHLKGPYDPSREGWAVASFLGVVQNP